MQNEIQGGTIEYYSCTIDETLPAGTPCTIELAYQQAQQQISRMQAEQQHAEWTILILIILSLVAAFLLGRLFELVKALDASQ